MKINYIRHLNAFFAQVRKDNQLRAHHVSLYMALFQVWNQHHFKKSFPILREEVVRLCRIGSMNTYTRCLKELHSYGYIHYQQGKMTMPGIVIMLPLPGTDDDTPQLLLSDKVKSTTDRNIDTQSRNKNATVLCIKNDTVPVAILRCFNNKQINNRKQERENGLPPSEKNYNNQVKNSCCDKDIPRAEIPAAAERILPDLSQVQEFFKASAYPATEASKFFHHYTANGWKQGGRVPITNWQAAAHKWILNINLQITQTHDRNTRQSTGAGRLQVEENKSYSEPL